MKKPAFLPSLLHTVRATGLAAWQTGRLFRQAAGAALDSVQEVLRAEVQKGNVQLVRDFLTDQALPTVKALLLERMAARLLVRIGLRGALATNVIGWILPFVLERLVYVGNKSGFFDKIKANTTVSEALHRLEELRRAAWKTLVPDAGSGVELLPDDAPAPLALPPAAPQSYSDLAP